MEFDNFVPSNFYLYIERLDGKSRERERERDFTNRIKKKKKILIIVLSIDSSTVAKLQNFSSRFAICKIYEFYHCQGSKGNRAMASYKL